MSEIKEKLDYDKIETRMHHEGGTMKDVILYKIVLASLLHDIGKVYQRAEDNLQDEFVKQNQDLYQPYEKTKGYYTHKHVLYTAKFIEDNLSYIPDLFLQDENPAYSLINLAASHHKPQSPWQAIITKADKLSSGYERRTFEKKENTTQDEKTSDIPLLSLFEDVSLCGQWKTKLSDYKYAYEISLLKPESIFPKEQRSGFAESEANKRAYKAIIQSFEEGFKNLSFLKERPDLWLESLSSLMLEHFLFIPSATVTYTAQGFERIPSDISLFDHSYFTASLAATLYLYHKETNTLSHTSYIEESDDEPKFLFIEGNFYGIQKFIFSSGGETRKWAAKLLRGRSFVVSLYTELVADYLLSELNLPFVSLLSSAAGKFLILCPNLDRIKQRLVEIEQEINDWLYDYYYGETSIGIVFLESKPNELIDKKGYQELMKNLSRRSEEKKYQKFDLRRYGGVMKEYFERFSGTDVCKLCGKRPAEKTLRIEEEGESIPTCKVCDDHRKIGEALVKNRYLLILKRGTVKSLTQIPILERFSLNFVNSVKDIKLSDNNILHVWDIGLTYDLEKSRNYFPRKFINAYVPHDETTGEIYTLEELSERSLTKKNGEIYGISALGVLKSDVDRLGEIFAHGLPEEKRTFSRYLTLSRMLNLFFSYYLPYLCKEKFPDIYNVFCGGDDLFVIGPWQQCLDFAVEINNSFKKYVCENSSFTLSAGYILTKPNIPVTELAERSENALSLAKNLGRNRIYIFKTDITWEVIPNLNELKALLKSYYEEGIITKSYLYKLNEITEMVSRAKKIMKIQSEKKYKDEELKQFFSITKDLLWHSYLYYFTVRNFKMKKGYKELEDFIVKLVEAFDKHGEAVRLPLWQILYSIRRYGYEQTTSETKSTKPTKTK